jgi:hypothetical protein
MLKKNLEKNYDIVALEKNKPTSRIGPLNATGGPSWRPNPVSAQRLQANRNGGHKGYIAGALCYAKLLASLNPLHSLALADRRISPSASLPPHARAHGFFLRSLASGKPRRSALLVALRSLNPSGRGLAVRRGALCHTRGRGDRQRREEQLDRLGDRVWLAEEVPSVGCFFFFYFSPAQVSTQGLSTHGSLTILAHQRCH